MVTINVTEFEFFASVQQQKQKTKKKLQEIVRVSQFLPHLTNSEYTEVRVKVKTIPIPKSRVYSRGYLYNFSVQKNVSVLSTIQSGQ